MIFFLLSQSILLPLIVGLIRFRRIGKSYMPFLTLLFIGFIVEIIGYILIQKLHKSNAIPVNIYILIEWVLIAWQFHIWGFLRHNRKAFYGLLAFTILFWIVENLFFLKIYHFSPYFRFFYSFFIVLLSVNEINFMITHYNRNLFRNPKFLICIGFIIYFLYMIIYRWSYEVSLFGKTETSLSIMVLIAYVNLLTNIIYTIAFLLIPRPVKFTLK
jgi:hypothetical protein